MSIRIGNSSLFSGVIVGNRAIGITGAAVRALPAGPHGRSIFHNDWQSAADDAVEFRAVPRSWPAGLTLFEDGTSIYDGPGASVVIDLYADGVPYGTSTLRLREGVVAVPVVRPIASTAAVWRPRGAFRGAHAVHGTVRGIASTAAVRRPRGVATLGQWIGPSGRYTGTRQLADRIGQSELIQITNPQDPTATAIDPVRMLNALDDIEALIDAKLSPRFHIPLASVPRLLSNIAADLLRARLYDDRIPESIANREKAALRLLDDIASGKLSLGLDLASQTTAPADGPSFFQGGASIFTADSLRDFAP